MESLRVSLETYYAEIIDTIAAANDIPNAEEHTKSELVNLLVEKIPRRAGDPATMAALSEAERAALAVTLKYGGQSPPSQVAVPLVLGGLIRLENVDVGPDTLPELNDVLESLLRQGFLVNLTPPVDRATRREFWPLRAIGIPPEVVRELPKAELSVPEPQLELLLTSPPERVAQRPMTDVLRHLFFVWAELRREPASALNQGGIYKRDARRLARSMGLPFSEYEDEIRFLVDILVEMDLLVETKDEIFVNEAENPMQFWEQSLDAQAKRVLSVIITLGSEIKVDLTSLQGGRGYYYRSISPRPVDVLYAEVMDIFGKMTDNVWFPLETFLGLLNGDRPGTFLFSQQTVTELYRELQWRSLQTDTSAYEARLEQALRTVERQTLKQILVHLKDLGVVMLGYADEEDSPEALRLTPLAHAAITGQPYEDVGAQLGQIVLQPDFQVLAMGPVPLSTLARIEHIAEREKVQPAAVTYRITRNSVYYALQADETLPSLLHFLEKVTEMPVPQNVERTLREWGAQHERIVLRQPVLVLQVDRPERLQALQQDEHLGEVLHPLDATTAWVPSHSALKVEQRLWELEMLPALSQGRDKDLPHSLTWDGGGRLRARHPLPSLYVVGNVARFAEAVEEDDDGWRLTPKSIQAAVSTGADVPEIIARVEEMTGATLSPEWEKRLKAWGSHYGDAQTAQVRLLRFETPKALAELRASERRLRRHLHPVGENTGHLAVVKEGHWDEVRALLDEWGVAVEETPWW